MAKRLSERFVRAISSDLLERYPEELVAHYRNLPGRDPGEVARKAARILAKLDEDEAAALIRDVIDAALFRLFYLLFDSSELDDLSVEVVEATEPNWDELFHETYRTMVDPGGIIVRDEA